MRAKHMFLIGWCLLWTMACSPEAEFLNSTEKREAARRVEETISLERPRWDSLCQQYQDSIQPFIIDSILHSRIQDMHKRRQVQ